MSKALELKEQGNRRFQAGDFIAADSLYSKAIIADPSSPALYTNRAMARLKLALWDSVVSDCQACLELSPTNMKAQYYLAQAYLALSDAGSALAHALKAHALCVATNDKSLAAVTAVVLRAKKERWDARERARRRETDDLRRLLEDLLKRRRDEDVADAGDDAMEREAIEEEAIAQAQRMRDVFERANAHSEDHTKHVPEWVVDDISFGIMVDPVITKTGKSYERASITEHLRRSQTDPLTREPLLLSDLRPNLALRQACDEFLEENGWAVDW